MHLCGEECAGTVDELSSRANFRAFPNKNASASAHIEVRSTGQGCETPLFEKNTSLGKQSRTRRALVSRARTSERHSSHPSARRAKGCVHGKGGLSKWLDKVEEKGKKKPVHSIEVKSLRGFISAQWWKVKMTFTWEGSCFEKETPFQPLSGN